MHVWSYAILLQHIPSNYTSLDWGAPMQPAEPPVQSEPHSALRLRCCEFCQLSYLENGRHRHCCKDCRLSLGRHHSRRCRREQRMINQHLSNRGYRMDSFCLTLGCDRQAYGSHETCCSLCGKSGGRLHTNRCHRQHSAMTENDFPAQNDAPAADTNSVAATVSSVTPQSAPMCSGLEAVAGSSMMPLMPRPGGGIGKNNQ